MLLCGIVAIALLSACGGGVRDIPKPAPTPDNPETPANTTSEHTIEQILTIKSDRPIDLSWKSVLYAYKGKVFVDGEEIDEDPTVEDFGQTYEGITSKEISIKAVVRGIPRTESNDRLVTDFYFSSSDDPAVAIINDLKTSVEYTIEEKIDGKTTKKERETIVFDKDNWAGAKTITLKSRVKYKN